MRFKKVLKYLFSLLIVVVLGFLYVFLAWLECLSSGRGIKFQTDSFSNSGDIPIIVKATGVENVEAQAEFNLIVNVDC